MKSETASPIQLKSDSGKSVLPAILIALLTGVCFFLLHTRNPEGDSWYYAACVKYQEELFNSHHLLYNLFGLTFYQLFQAFHLEVSALESLFIMNAAAGALSYLFLFLILQKLGLSRSKSLLLPLFAVFSFGFFRFATDAETYIVPILFSLISSYYYSLERKSTNLLLAGFFSALAILVHQVQIWWTLALLIHLLFGSGKDKIRSSLEFALPLLLVPVSYFLVYSICFREQFTFFDFLLGEYKGGGNASLSPGFQSFKLTFSNVIRSFIQVHGRIITLFSLYRSFIWIPAIIILLLAVGLTRKGDTESEILKTDLKWTRTAIFLHIFFAFLSSGNAEFMAMIPVLVVIGYAPELQRMSIPKSGCLLAALLAWNLGFGILPLVIFNTNNNNPILHYAKSEKNICVLMNKALIENVLTYEEGFKKREHLISLKNADSAFLRQQLNQGLNIFSDHSNLIERFSRASFVQLKKDEDFPGKGFKTLKVDSFKVLGGQNFILKIEGTQ